MIMPLGKYKGKKIEQIPFSYLKWLVENCKVDVICSKADEEYRTRTDHNDHWEEKIKFIHKRT